MGAGLRTPVLDTAREGPPTASRLRSGRSVPTATPNRSPARRSTTTDASTTRCRPPTGRRPGPTSYSSRSMPVTGKDRRARRFWRRFRCGSSSTTSASSTASPCWCHQADTRPAVRTDVSPPASRGAAVPDRTGGDGSDERIPEVTPRSSRERPTTDHGHGRHDTVTRPVRARNGPNHMATDPGPYPPGTISNEASSAVVVSPRRTVPTR